MIRSPNHGRRSRCAARSATLAVWSPAGVAALGKGRHDVTGESVEPGQPVSRVRGLRQRRVSSGPRTVSHRVKVTPEQEARLLLKAAPRGITVARLLVESALAGGADAANTRAEFRDELYRLTRLLGKVSVNINQIARATNTTFESQPDTAAAIVSLGRVTERLETLLADMDGTSS